MALAHPEGTAGEETAGAMAAVATVAAARVAVAAAANRHRSSKGGIGSCQKRRTTTWRCRGW